MILQGDNRIVMPTLKPESFHCCITSPPYLWVRDYGVPPSDWPEVTYIPMTGCQPITVPAWTGCLGLEPTVEMFVAHIVLTMRDVWRLLRKDGTLWLNFGDTYYGSGKGCNANGQRNFKGKDKAHNGRYTSNLMHKGFKSAGLKPKDLIMVPARIALALQADGWYARLDIIWHKNNAMPESVKDRPSKAHEYMYLFSKSRHYYYDPGAVNKRSVWSMATANMPEAHFAVFPDKLPETAVLAGSSPKACPNCSAPWKRKIVKTGHTNKREKAHVPGNSSTKADSTGWAYTTKATETFISSCKCQGNDGSAKCQIFDPFGGSGTTRKVALENNRECTLIEINPDYIAMEERRTAIIQPKLF